MTAPATPTCLFTGQTLPLETREEHTIQRGIGGRLRSRLVSSTDFNERCGGVLDGVLTQLYADVMSILGPVLPVESLGGARPIQLRGDAPGRYVVTNQGQLTLRGTEVVERDPKTGRPTAVIGVDETAMRNIIDRNIQPGAIERRRMELPPAQEGVFGQRPVLCTEIEVAVLKAALLTCDHQLRADPERFTWDDSLCRVREAIRGMVMNRTPVDRRLMIDTVLGLQYEPGMLELYSRIRSSVPFAETPFEHVLIASGNPGARVLDIVFWAYRTDLYLYRIRGWPGSGFTLVIVNGILRNTTCSEAFQLPQNQLLGQATQRRSNQLVTRHPTVAERQAIHQEIFGHRLELCRRAVDHVEHNCDELVVGNLDLSARLNPSEDRTVRGAVRRRLELFYGHRIGDDADRADFDAILDRELVPPVLLQPDGSGDDVIWPYWLVRHRSCLTALQARFGLPGEYFVAGEAEVASQDGQRVLGDWPACEQPVSRA